MQIMYMVGQFVNIYLIVDLDDQIKKIKKFDVNFIGKNSPDGCTLEFDLEYLDEAHE